MARRVATVKSSVPVPAADCVDGFTHPRDTKRLLGHDNACLELGRGFDSGKIHHGWLLSGPSGIGKATLAYRFAKYVLSVDGERNDRSGPLGIDGEGPTSRLVSSQAHPGLLVIRRPYDFKSKRLVGTIPVDEVRRVRSFLTHSGGDGSWRVVIIDTADEMNVNAANAVLKSLEEPPVRTVFLLITSEPGRLLPTIRSRCRSLALGVLGKSDLQAACEQAFSTAGVDVPAFGDWDALLALGRGRVGRVLSLHGMGGAEVFEDVSGVLAKAARPDWSAVHKLGDKLAPVAALARFGLFYELLLEQLSALVHSRATGEGIERDVALAGALIAREQIGQWAALWEDIVRDKADVSALNLDRKAFLIETVQKIHELAARPGG